MSAARFFCPATRELSPGLPPVALALTEPNGLLAIGGGLEPATLLDAYRHGVFPWYAPDQPILWWSPDPRAVLYPARFHASRSLLRSLRRRPWRITIDRAFERVIEACAAPRHEGADTWLTPEMIAAYCRLQRLGHAHSLECWLGDELVGGVYGVAIGTVFCAESMFSRVTDASKIALHALCARLVAWGYELLDCQVENPHLRTLGAEHLSRARFCEMLAASDNGRRVNAAAWRDDTEGDAPA